MRAFVSLCGALVLLALIITGCSDDTATGPTLPRVPSNPSPANGDSIFFTNVYLHWDCSHPEGKVLRYEVYFDTVSPPQLHIIHTWRSDSIWIEPQYIQREETYYWKVVAVDENYISITGPIWSFAVGPPRDFPPNSPSSPSPADGDTAVLINENLEWACFDSGGEQPLFDVYFGTDSLPPLVVSGRYGRYYDPGPLLENTTYFWKIAAEDSSGHRAEGPVWSFTTSEIVNQPPSVPHDPSPSNDRADIQPSTVYLYWACSDPEDDPITYTLHFGTANPPPFKKNLTLNYVEITDTETLLFSETYYWKVNASDRYGNTSEGPVWSFHTIPANLTQIGGYDISGDQASGLFVRGGYAYLGTNTSGLIILDISDPANPDLAGLYLGGNGFGDIEIAGDYAYINHNGYGIDILDISAPTTPVLIGRLPAKYGEIGIAGDYMYLARGYFGVEIVDIGDRANPAPVGSIATDYARDVCAAGSYAYVADDWGGLLILDVSTPSTPFLYGLLERENQTSIFVDGRYVFSANRDRGVQVIDVVNPASPTLLLTIDVTNGAHHVHVAGQYAFYATDERGIYVVDISDPANAFIAGTNPEPYNPIMVSGAGNIAYAIYGQSTGGPEFRVFRLGP